MKLYIASSSTYFPSGIQITAGDPNKEQVLQQATKSQGFSCVFNGDDLYLTIAK